MNKLICADCGQYESDCKCPNTKQDEARNEYLNSKTE